MQNRNRPQGEGLVGNDDDIAQLFSVGQRMEIASIFGKSIEEAETPFGVVDRIQTAVRHYLECQNANSHRVSELPNSDAVSMACQQDCIRKIIARAEELRGLMDLARERDFCIVDDIDYRSNIIGSLALSGPSKRQQVPFGEVDTAENLAFLSSGDHAFASIMQGLEHLSNAAQIWLSYYDRRTGRPPSINAGLICTLDRTCTGLITTCRSGATPDGYSPAAPNSVLCRTLAIVFEALGWAAPANLPQAIRRALKQEELNLADTEVFYAEAHGYIDQK